MKQNLNKKILTLIITAVVLAAAAITVALLTQPTKQLETSSQTTGTTETKDNVVKNKDTIKFTAVAGSSALDQLKDKNDSVIVIESEIGSLVDSINGLAGGTDGKYWSFYVDGEMAAVGAGQFIPKGGEEIEWKFQKF